MDQTRSFSSLPSSYDPFLFSRIFEDANGMPISVLSAFARINLDAWDEARRLGAMSRENAQSSFVSMLNLIPGRSWNPSEIEAIAARLIQLLPHGKESTTQTPAVGAGAGPTRCWLVIWLTLALMVSFLSQQHQATDATAPMSESAQQLPKGDDAVGALPTVAVPSR